MKKKGLIGIILFVVAGSSLFYFSYGVPWEMMAYKSKFEEYLEKKYNQVFVINDVYFDFLHGRTYHGEATPVNYDVKFYVGQHPDTKKFEDSYHTAMWQRQAEKELTPIIEKYYPDNSGLATNVVLEEHPSILATPGIPNYKTHISVEIAISLKEYTITAETRQDELNRVYLLLKELQERNVKLYHVDISYQNKTMQLPGDFINHISTVNDLDRYLVNYK